MCVGGVCADGRLWWQESHRLQGVRGDRLHQLWAGFPSRQETGQRGKSFTEHRSASLHLRFKKLTLVSVFTSFQLRLGFPSKLCKFNLTVDGFTTSCVFSCARVQVWTPDQMCRKHLIDWCLPSLFLSFPRNVNQQPRTGRWVKTWVWTVLLFYCSKVRFFAREERNLDFDHFLCENLLLFLLIFTRSAFLCLCLSHIVHVGKISAGLHK